MARIPTHTIWVLALTSTLLWAPATVAAEETYDAQNLAMALVERMNLQPGEQVLLMAGPGRFDPLVAAVRKQVEIQGGIDLGALSVTIPAPEEWETEFTERLENREPSVMVPVLEEVDLAVMMPGAMPVHPPYAAMQDVLWNGRGRTIHFHWTGAYDLEEQPLAVSPAIDAFYQRVILETDYKALAAHQRDFEKAIRGQTVRVTTPAGTDLQFEIEERPVTRQDGDASAARAAQGRNLIDREIEIPAGAVRMAPLESTVMGTIAFPPSNWQRQRVEGLKMRFEKGRVMSFEAAQGAEAVAAELDAAGEAGSMFREFVLGMNPLLAIPTEGEPWIPYYGYGAGIVRLSLGDNSELGGDVTGGYVRWNFFTDATVTVGDEIWVRDGELVR